MSRVLYETPEFLVIHPFASKSPFETWILPRTHHSSFDEISQKGDIEALAHILTWTLGRLYICLDDPAYNMVFKIAPFPALDRGREEPFRFYHWYIVIEPQRLVTPGGYELSTGIPVNLTPPESDPPESDPPKSDVDGGEPWKGSAEFFRSRGVLFEDDKNKVGTLLWYLEPPTEEEGKINITWESKQKTLRNIVEVLQRENTSDVPEHRLTGQETQRLKEIEAALKNAD